MLFGILDVEPKGLERNVGFVEAALDVQDVVLAEVVPAATLVVERKELRKCGASSQGRVRVEGVGRGRAEVVRAAGPASSVAAEPFLPFLNADVTALLVEPLVMSTQVSEPVTRKTATEEPAR